MTLRYTPQEIVDELINQGRAGALAGTPDWPRVRLGDVARVVNGAPFRSTLFNVDGVGLPLIRIRDVGSSQPSTWYSGEWEKVQLVRRGDLLVGMDGDFKAAHWGGEDALLNQRVCRLDLLDTCFDGRFFFHALQPYLDAIWAATSSTTVKHLSSKSIADIPLPCPPIDEQRRIVTVLEDHLSRLDAADAYLSDAIRRTDLLARAHLRSLLRQPGTWEGTLSDVCGPAEPPAAVVAAKTYLDEGSWPVVDQGDGDVGGYTENEHAVYRGELPVLVFGDHTRRVKYVDQTFAVGAQGTKLLRPQPGIDPRFAFWTLKDVDLPGRGYGRHYALLRASRPRMAKSDLQREVVAAMDKAADDQASLQRSLDRQQVRRTALRRALLTAAFTGRLTGRSSDLDVAEELAEAAS